jgi:hypothetical protein
MIAIGTISATSTRTGPVVHRTGIVSCKWDSSPRAQLTYAYQILYQDAATALATLLLYVMRCWIGLHTYL